MTVRTAYPGTASAGALLHAADVKKLPGGWIGEASAVANQTGITTETALTGLSVTVTVAASRLLRVTGHGRASRTVADGLMLGTIKEDGVAVGRWLHHQPSAATEMGTGHGFVLRRPAAGAHTYALFLERFSGTGTVATDAAASAPAYITVEDLGPAS
jgi:hypothetical protein